eukprot:6197435-Pleurochrysis_carterae.AAC.4
MRTSEATQQCKTIRYLYKLRAHYTSANMQHSWSVHSHAVHTEYTRLAKWPRMRRGTFLVLTEAVTMKAAAGGLNSFMLVTDLPK